MSDWNGRRMRISRDSVKKRGTSLLSMDDAENSQVIKKSSFEKGTCSKTNGRSNDKRTEGTRSARATRALL